jgi:hypothetical protein
MKSSLSLLLIILFLALSCNPQKSKLKERWVLLENKTRLSKDFESFNQVIIDLTGPRSNVRYKSAISGSFLQLNSGNNYNFRIGSIYTQGKWNLKNDSTLVFAAGKDTIPMQIIKCVNDTLQVRFISGHNLANYLDAFTESITLTFIPDTITYYTSNNPYSFKANEWAVKAKHKLTEQEIKDKLVNFIDYLIMVLKDSRKNENYIELITNPINVASNGLSLINSREVDPEWRNLFYDDEGFKIAYQILLRAFESDIKLLPSGDTVEFDVDILKQIKVFIKKYKSLE